jgi:2-polyprenyl-6-methoxyphenol hydroxylase-like FAD-dependent oxidoreductase
VVTGRVSAADNRITVALMGAPVVVVGGGPGGVLLTYLLARGGVAVTLLEARHDFARRFRGDTLAPGVLEYLDDLGLAQDPLAEVPYNRSDEFRSHAPRRTYELVDYRGVSRRFPLHSSRRPNSYRGWPRGPRRSG